MLKMSTCGVGLLLAGLVGLACSNPSGLRLGGGSTSGGQGIAGTGGSTGGGLATGQSDCERAGGACGPNNASRLFWLEPQHRRVFLRIKHDLLLYASQLFALRNRRGDVC